MKIQTIYPLVLVALCFVRQSQAQGTFQFNFDGPPIIPPNAQYGVTNYYESGMSFMTVPVQTGFIRNGGGISFYPDDGSAYIQQTLAPTAPVMFKFTNGLAFGLFSVDLAEYSTVSPEAVTVEFIGFQQDGSTVTNYFTTDGIIDGTGPLADFQTFYFSGFTDLTRVEIPASTWSLDNLVVSVPEPTSSALLLAGGLMLGGLKLCQRQRRK